MSATEVTQPAYIARTRRKQATRIRILTTAADLFYQSGFTGVTMGEVAAAAQVSKPTLYKHFATKDDLIGASLETVDHMHFQWFVHQTEQRASTGVLPALAVFDVLAKWFRSPAFRGCAFINASIELNGNIPTAQTAVLRHKERTRHWLSELSSRSKIPPAAIQLTASHLMIVMEGAIVTALVERRENVAVEARAIAEVLLANQNACS